jgi:hypothetical protein
MNACSKQVLQAGGSNLTDPPAYPYIKSPDMEIQYLISLQNLIQSQVAFCAVRIKRVNHPET